jgi:hypothetical protein
MIQSFFFFLTATSCKRCYNQKEKGSFELYSHNHIYFIACFNLFISASGLPGSYWKKFSALPGLPQYNYLRASAVFINKHTIPASGSDTVNKKVAILNIMFLYFFKKGLTTSTSKLS